MSPMAAYVIETFVTLLAVVTIALGVIFAARRLGVGRASGPMRLLGRLPLDARRAVYLVRVADQVLVLGVSEAGLSKLGELKAADVPEPPATPTIGFGEVLARLRAQPKTPARTEGGDSDA